MVLLFLTEVIYSLPVNPDIVDHIRQNLNGEDLITEVVALEIQGTRLRDHIIVEDMGIVIRDEKYLPLLHILELLNPSITLKADTVYMQLPSSSINMILVKKNQMRLGKAPVQSMTCLVGRSDISQKQEIFLKAADCSRLLNISLEWDENQYQFTGHTKENFNIFRKFDLPNPSFLAQNAVHALQNLPEKLPPARPGFSSKFLTFIQTTLYGNAAGFFDPQLELKANTTNINYQTQGQLDIWGRLFSGNYHLAIRKNYFINLPYYRPPPLYLEGNWEKYGSQMAASLGDQSMGLGEIVFPYLSLRGIVVTLGQRTENGANPHYRYNPSYQTIEGYTQKNSTVKLFINGNLIEEQLTKPDPKAPVGQEIYRFRNVNLLQNQVNEIRLIIANDETGYYDEIQKEIIGSRDNLQKGQIKITTGVGTARISSINQDKMQGFFSGGSFQYGLTNGITMGIMGGVQKDFSISSPLYSLGSGSYKIHTPQSSQHLSGITALRFLRRFILTGQVAASKVEEDQEIHLGGYTRLQTNFGSFRSTVSAYRIQPRYFDGVNSLLENRDGITLNMQWRPFSRFYVNYMDGIGRDYLEDWQNNTWQDRFNTLQFQFNRIFLLQKFKISLTTRKIGHLPLENLYNAEADFSINHILRLRGRWSVGDIFQNSREIHFWQRFGLNSQFFFETPGSNLNLYWNPKGPWSGFMSITRSDFYTTSMISVSRQNFGKKGLAISSNVAKDWNNDRLYIQNNLEYSLDRSGGNRIGLSINVDQQNWYGQISFQLQNILGFQAGGLHGVKIPQFYPENGGIWGRLFLDKNINGKLDSDEIGLEKIPVILQTEIPKRVETNKNGIFYFPIVGSKDSVRVSIDINNLPAIYVPTNGTQLIHVEPGAFTLASLGVTKIIELNGFVKREKGVAPDLSPQQALRVYLVPAKENSSLSESVTANDGSFYFGNILPGKYYILIDPRSLSPNDVVRLQGIPQITTALMYDKLREHLKFNINPNVPVWQLTFDEKNNMQVEPLTFIISAQE